MSIESLSQLKTQLKFAERLAKTLLTDESFALLTGDSGSGRTTMCEQVVNLVDGKCLAVFIPCRREMSIEQLRELFLQQLLPGQDWELGNKLGDTLMTLHIPTPQKILVVADDVDEVLASFFDELQQVASDFQGQNRFSFLTTGHPLWAQSRISAPASQISLTEWPMPLLTMEEAMQLCKATFSARGLLPVYREISGKLPYKLEQCQGNVGKILKLTEILMAKPDQINEEQEALAEAVSLESGGSRKKRSTVVIFITVLCMVIALACLAPLFLGSNFFKGLLGGGTGEPEVTETLAEDNGEQPGLDPFANPPAVDGEEPEEAQGASQMSLTEDGAPGSAQSGTGPGETQQEGKIRRKSRAGEDTTALDSILADDGPKGSAEEAAEDGGDLLEAAQGGVEAESTAAPKNSVTLSGETLEEIEKRGAESQGSERPRPGLGGSVDKQAGDGPQAEAPASNKVVLTRQDNALRMEELRKAQEAASKAQEEERRAATAKREAEEIAQAEERIRKEEAQRRQQAATASVAQPQTQSGGSRENRPQTQTAAPAQRGGSTAQTTAGRSERGTVSARNVAATGSAVAGTIQELAAKPRNRYTVQVVASSDRRAVAGVAGALNGRYWIYETVRENRPWYVLITGDYGSAQEAIRSVSSLPRSLRGAGPFAKSFGTVRQEIAAQ